MSDVLKLRAGQRRFHQFVDQHRIAAFIARRQYGKTTTVGGIALKKMMRTRMHTVIFGSAKLSLSREIVRKEAQIMQAALASLPSSLPADPRALRTVDAGTGKTLHANLSADDFAEVFEAQRLEFRYFHSNNASDYSRTKVVALLPDAVGETGDLITDEVGRVRNWREVVEAILPIISSNPAFRWIQTTTPTPDDAHYSFEMLAPPLGMEWKPKADGHEYVSGYGVHVLRLDAFDAHADGVPLYDDNTGAPLTPAAHRAKARDKDAWDRNYGCKFIIGGSSACGLLLLDTAQRRGIGQCANFVIDDDLSFDSALAFLARNLSANKAGIGVDWATTEKTVSNPTSVAVMEEDGAGYLVRAVFNWKTSDPDVATDRLRRIVQAVNARPQGGRARRLCQDATSEKYHCENIRKELRALVPVENVVASETIERPGGDTMTLKQFLGSQYVGELEDNHLTLPPERYLREDHRMVKREKGSFQCEADATGRHGDTFDACKLALHALAGRRNDGRVIPSRVGAYAGGAT